MAAASGAQSADRRWVPVKVRYYPTAVEAAPDRAALEEAGIPTVLQDDMVTALEWPLHRAVGGTKIAVPADRVEEAVEVLGGEMEPDADGVPDWLSEEDRGARRVATVGLLSLLLCPLAPYYWVLRTRFLRDHPDASPAARRQLRRSLPLALLASLMLAFVVVMLILDLATPGPLSW